MKIGDIVTISSLKRTGELVSLSDKEAKVRFGGITISCSVNELSVSSKSPSSKAKKSSERVHRGALKSGAALIDLHGKTSAVAREMLINFINTSIMKGFSEIRITHGRGSGVLLKTTHEVLGELDVVGSFKLSEGNPGVTIAYLQVR